MIAVRVIILAAAIIGGLTGCASSHTRHHHTKHTGHSSHHSSSKRHKTQHYTAPARPAPYTLPGGLQSVCTGGTPPPCN